MSDREAHIPVFSIVTPSYNQGQYIEETIKSVISQAGAFYIEYFIMDGGSTDGSVDVMRRYDRLIKDNVTRISCLGVSYEWASGKDKGQSDAINKGLRRATGDFVSWINSDDLYEPGAFAAIAEHMRAHPGCDFVYGDGEVIDENGGLQWVWKSRRYDYNLLKTYDFRRNQFTNYIMQQSVFWRRSVHDRLGLLDDAFHYAMDYEYWLRAGAAGLNLCHLPVRLGKFRMIRNTKSLSSPTVFWPESMELFRRYNGAEAMEPYFVHYFFNEGRHNGCDAVFARAQEEILFKRWDGLDSREIKILREKAAKAFSTARLMLAREAFLCGGKENASLLFRGAVSDNPMLLVNLHSLRYLVARALGKGVFALEARLDAKLRKFLRLRLLNK